MLAPRPYQRDLIDAVYASWARGKTRPMAVLPTGGGKTIAFANIVREQNLRTLVLAHRDELVEQAVDKIRRTAPEMTVGVMQGTTNQVLCKVVVASVQTLARQARLDQLKASAGHKPGLFAERLGQVALVIVDEAHHAVSENTYGKVLRELGAFDDGGPRVIGFTATPERMDRRRLSSVWQEIAFQHGLLDGIREGYLCEPKGIEAQLAVDFNQIHVRAGDYAADELDALLRAADAPHHVVASYLEHAAGRRAIVFTVTVKGAYEMAEAFRLAGVAAEAIDGNLGRDDRRGVLARLRSGETQVVCNAAVLTEGFDEPSISCVVIARPTRSRVLAIQMIGRGLRLYPGKTECLVIDTVGMSRRTDLVTLSQLLAGEERKPRKRPALMLDGLELLPAPPEESKPAEQEPEPTSLVYRQFDLRTGSCLNWIETKHGQWVLGMGKHGTVHVVQEPEGVRVVRLWKDATTGQLKKATVKTVASVAEAQLDAEQRVRRVGLVNANSRWADWRKRPPTESQAAALERLGLPVPRSMGEASDLLTANLTRAV